MVLVALALTAAAPFHLHEKGRDIDFEYSWPREASAIPSLEQQLKAQLKHDRRRSAALARADHDQAAAHGYPFHRHSFYRSITFVGASARIASFIDHRSTYTGGAHPNPSTGALLWDKESGRSVKFSELFLISPSPIIRPAYCEGLAAERMKKLGRPTPAPGGYWEVCPDPLNLSVVPKDRDGNGRFDELAIIASPYAVGSYAEGEYDVELPVTPQLIAAIKPAYRNSFEAQRQRSGAGAG
jgi:hypothetical protein